MCCVHGPHDAESGAPVSQMVCEHEGLPPPPHFWLQMDSASPTHCRSHSVEQQNAFFWQTLAAHGPHEVPSASPAEQTPCEQAPPPLDELVLDELLVEVLLLDELELVVP